MIRVLLVDDHEIVRTGLAQILTDTQEFSIVGQASSGAEAIRLAHQEHPDVIVLDYSMDDMDAPAVLEGLGTNLKAKVLILTVHENIHYAVKVLEAGADGYVIKSAAVQELVTAVQSVSRGEVYISPRVSQHVLRLLKQPVSQRDGLAALSAREFEVLRHLGAGMSSQGCAAHLSLSTSTVSTYRTRLMEKLNLQSTTEIIRFAIEHDIVG